MAFRYGLSDVIRQWPNQLAVQAFPDCLVGHIREGFLLILQARQFRRDLQLIFDNKMLTPCSSYTAGGCVMFS